MSKYSITSPNGLVFWVINNETGHSVSNHYTDRSMAQMICNQFNLKDDMSRI
jgi:hypothetical protein